MGRPSFHAQVLIIPIPSNISVFDLVKVVITIITIPCNIVVIIYIDLVKVAITIITIVISVMLPVDICRGSARWENTAMCEKEEADWNRWGKLVRMTMRLVIMRIDMMTVMLAIMRIDVVTN